MEDETPLATEHIKVALCNEDSVGIASCRFMTGGGEEGRAFQARAFCGEVCDQRFRVILRKARLENNRINRTRKS